MAKITKKSSLSIKGVPSVTDDGIIVVQVDGLANPISLAEYATDFMGNECSISFSVSNDEA